MSFEPVSADMQIVMQTPAGNSDMYIGLSYSEGLGKVSIYPQRSGEADSLSVQAHQGDHHSAAVPGQEYVLLWYQASPTQHGPGVHTRTWEPPAVAGAKIEGTVTAEHSLR